MKMSFLKVAQAVAVGNNETSFKEDEFDIEEIEEIKIKITHKTKKDKNEKPLIAWTSIFNAAYWKYSEVKAEEKPSVDSTTAKLPARRGAKN